MTRRNEPLQWLVVSALTLSTVVAVRPGLVRGSPARSGEPEAQQQVPEEMVLALLKNMYQPVGTPEPRVLVGQIADELNDRLVLPEDATVYGSVVQPDSVTEVGDVGFPTYGSITVVAGVDSPPDEAKAWLRARMPSLDWRLNDAFDRIGPQTQSAAMIPLLFCSPANDSLFVLADSRGGDASRTLLRISFATDSDANPCRPRPEPRRRQPPPRDIPRGPERARVAERLRLGDLLPPPSSFMVAGRCPTGGASLSTTQMSTELSAAEIVEHYGAQLEEIGWLRSDPDTPPAAASAGWHRTLEGEPYEAVLQVVQHPGRPNCYSVQISTTFDGLR